MVAKQEYLYRGWPAGGGCPWVGWLAISSSGREGKHVWNEYVKMLQGPTVVLCFVQVMNTFF